MQKGSMYLNEVFKYSLVLFPLAMAGSVRNLKKTNKAALVNQLEKSWIQ